MEGSSLCSLTGKMECPGLLSKGDLNPFPCPCLVHSQIYRVSVVGWPVWGPVVVELDFGWGNRWATASSNDWATLFNSSPKARNSMKMSTFEDVHIWGSTEKRGKTIRLLSFSSFLLLCISLPFLFVLFFCFFFVFFFYILCVGSQIKSCRSLNGLPQVISGVHIVLWITVSVRS